MKPLLVDTGPLVALIRKSDRDHERCVQLAQQLRGPLLTTWPVITEAAWLLKASTQQVDALFQMITGSYVVIEPLKPESMGWIRGFYRQYADLRPQLADASLMYLANRLGVDEIFTLDRRDFSVYRLENGAAVRILPESR